MSTKQLFVILTVLFLSFAAMISGLFWVAQNTPELVGLPPKILQVDSLAAPELDSTLIVLELERIQNLQVQVERDSLLALVQSLTDSVAQSSQAFDSISAVVKSEDDLREKERLQEIVRQDSLTRKNHETFAKMFDSATPQEVAGILQNLDERDAAEILKLMKTKNAAKVLESLTPEKAASILILSSIDL